MTQPLSESRRGASDRATRKLRAIEAYSMYVAGSEERGARTARDGVPMRLSGQSICFLSTVGMS